ncbi:complex I assembly factor ACAD9, mitochondrial-like isoform X2 [Watersipora subatra]
MLVFPEVCSEEELADLEAMVEPIEKFFDNLDSTAMDREANIPDTVLETMKSLGLFGLQIPEEYGGLNLNATKFARIAEITGRDGGLSVTLAAHQSIGLKGILIAGTEEQKQKYLPSLASGEKLAAFCLTEPSSGSDAASIQTKAQLSPDGKQYLLNGSKIWISNGGIADIFTVFAKTPFKNQEGEVKDKVTAFIVERSFGGVTNGPPEDKLGIRGSNTCELHFDNTPVPVENVIGEVGGGFKLAMNILNGGRFSMGTSCAGALRKLVEKTMEHALTRKQFDKELIKFELIQQKFAKMAIAIYAMESMAYMTAGIIDAYQKPDASIEAAIVKVYSSENTWIVVSECLQILGGLGYMKSYPYERYLRDARILPIFEGTNEILRLYISLTGFDYVGKYYQDAVRKLNNPMNNLGFIWKQARLRYKERNVKKSTWLLHEHTHPLMESEANSLESYTKQLRSTVELLLARYKRDIVDQQMPLARVADVVSDLYGMTAVLARVSRSLSIGLPHCEHERRLAVAFCYDAGKRIEANLHELTLDVNKVGYNMDECHRMIADKMATEKGYFATSPLQRNW